MATSTSARKRAGNFMDRPRVESAMSMAQKPGIALLTDEPYNVGTPMGLECPHDKRVKVDGKSVRVKGATALRQFRDHNACVFCGKPIVFHAELTRNGLVERGEMDRITPGSAYKEGLVQPACRRCNAARQDRPLSEFVALYRGKMDLVEIAAAESR